MARANSTKTMIETHYNDKQLQEQLNNVAAAFKGEKTVKVSIPKTYEKYIGPTLPIGINGVFVVLPVDGSEHPVPETFAKHLKDYLNNYK